MDRNKKILICLLVVFLVTLIYRVNHPFKQQTVDALTYQGKRAGNGHVVTMKIPAATPDRLKGEAPYRVMIACLSKPPRHNGAVSKNLFFPQPKIETPVHAAPAEPEVPPEETVTAPLKPIDPMTSVKAALGRFTVIGTYESRGERAVFLQRGRETLVVKEGDRIDGRYRVMTISDQSMAVLAEKIGEVVYMDLSGL